MPSIEELNQAQEMLAFYERYYAAAAHSPAYGEFCTRVFGRNYSQHGFADMAQIELLVKAAQLRKGGRVLELGCGNGGLAAHIASATGALVVGVDYAQAAISQAQVYAAANPRQLAFLCGDIGRLPFGPASFDAILAIDALYFTELARTLCELGTLLRPGGQLLAFYSYGADPFVPIDQFPKADLPPDRTDLAVALHHAGFSFDTWDLTAADYRHAQCKQAVLAELQPRFAAEDTLFLYESRMGEARGVIAAVEAGAHARYLYRCTQSNGSAADSAQLTA